MIKKFIYHSSFAVLGVSLLLGMAILQANGLKTSDSLAANSDDQMDSVTVPDNSPTDVAAQPKPEEEVQVAQLPVAAPAPAPVSSIVPQKVAVPTPKMAPAPVKSVPEVIIKDVPLDNAQAFAVYDSHRKDATRKTFTITPNGLRNALAYYKHLASHYGKRAMVQAKMPDGSWTAIPTASFKHHIAKTLN